ncbi:olfactory receptor 2G3-like, partial [Silurus meridionalis]
SLNESQISVQWSSEVTSCLFWSIIYNEFLLNLSIFTILILFTFSLVVNIYLLLGLEHSEALSWKPRYVLLKNLIVSDLLLTVTISLPEHRETNVKHDSLLTITSMALERFVYTCHGIHYLGIMTNMRLYCFMILIWLLALAGAGSSTALVLMGRANFGRILAGFVCEPEVLQAQLEPSNYFETFNKIFIASVLFLCLLVFSFSYGRMYQEARQVQQPFQQDNARARCTILFYFAIFLLQLFPSIIKLITMFSRDVDNHVYIIMLVLVPPCINPVAYGIRNKEVSQALGRLCGSKKPKE